MAVSVEVRYEDQPAKQLKRAAKDAGESMRDAGRLWQRRFLPLHFTTAAHRRYDYSPRTKRYEIRKAKTKRHRNPLVFTGESRRRALALTQITLRRSRGEHVGTVRIAVPSYFFQHPGTKASGRFIDKPKELTATSRDEEIAVAELARRRVLRSLGEKPEKLRVTLR